MYSIYNSDTYEQLIDTMHKMYNKTTWNEKLFASKLNLWYHWYLSKDEVGHYVKYSLLFLTKTKENMSKCMRDLSFNCKCMSKQ